MLVDSSVWIEYLRATGSSADLRLQRAIRGGEPVATTGQILMEVLAGAGGEEHERDLRRLLARAEYLPTEDPSDFEAAARLFSACRRSGVTVRRLGDCLIAVVAIRAGVDLLHRNSDFDRIAACSALRVAR